MRPAQWAEVEITIAAATPAPIAHIVSKKWVMIDANFDTQRLSTRTSDFDFLVFLLIIASFIWPPRNRKAASKATRTSAAVGFEPTPTPEAESVGLRLGAFDQNARKASKATLAE
jgi:hypothetical protein